MRALVFVGSRQLEVQDRDTPLVEAGEALLRVTSTGICGSDLHGYLGITGRRAPGMVMGHEVAAVIEEAPPGSGWLPGDRVTFNPVLTCGECDFCSVGRENLCRHRRIIGVVPDRLGGYSEFMTVPTDNLVRLSDQIPLEWGSLVEPLAVGYHAAIRSGCRTGRTAVVVGGGPIGLACYLGCRRLGADPIFVSEPNPARRAVAERLGAITVDPTDGALLAGVMAATAGKGADVVLEAVGISQTMSAAVEVCAPDGTVVLVGMGDPVVDLPLYAVTTLERRLLGALVYTREEFRDTAGWVNSRPSELEGLIDIRVGFDGVVELFRSMAAGEAQPMKAVLLPDLGTT